MEYKLFMRDGELVTTFYDREIDNTGDLVCELNLYLNNGYVLKNISLDGVYTLEEDENQLMYVTYHDPEKDLCYYGLLTHAQAFCFRQYYDCPLNVIYHEGEEKEFEDYVLNPEYVCMIDARKQSDKLIEFFKSQTESTVLFLWDAIEEDLSNY